MTTTREYTVKFEDMSNPWHLTFDTPEEAHNKAKSIDPHTSFEILYRDVTPWHSAKTSIPIPVTYKLFLDEVPRNNQIKAIKEVRSITGCTLLEAKDTVDLAINSIPQLIAASPDEYKMIFAKDRLRRVGARVHVE